MLHPFRSEVRTRHEYLVMAQTRLTEHLQNAETAAFLGESACRKFLALSEELVMPNIKGSGTIKLPQGSSSEGIPYIVAQTDAVYTLDEATIAPTPVQEHRMREAISSWNVATPKFINTVVRTLMESAQEPHASPLKDGYGFTIYSYARLRTNGGEDSQIYEGAFRGRPILGLASGSKLPEVTLLHELEHVRQVMEQPIVPGDAEVYRDYRMSGELRSHHYQARLMAALTEIIGAEIDEPEFNDACIVEAIRANNARPDSPFCVTPEMLHTFEAAGVTDRIMNGMKAVTPNS